MVYGDAKKPQHPPVGGERGGSQGIAAIIPANPTSPHPCLL